MGNDFPGCIGWLSWVFFGFLVKSGEMGSGKGGEAGERWEDGKQVRDTKKIYCAVSWLILVIFNLSPIKEIGDTRI